MNSSAFLIAVFEFVLLIFSLSVHECAHAWMASRLGDQTARLEGRITLNPIYHVDPIGTLLFPALVLFGPIFGFNLFSGMLIGWARPTPVITRNLRRIVRDGNLVSLAGPAANLLLVAVAFVVLAVAAFCVPGGRLLLEATLAGGLMVGPSASGMQALMLLGVLAIEINLSLFYFNLLPVPPLDGSRIVRNLLPYNALAAYDRLGGTVGYLLMIFVGGALLRLLLAPSLHLVFGLLLGF